MVMMACRLVFLFDFRMSVGCGWVLCCCVVVRGGCVCCGAVYLVGGYFAVVVNSVVFIDSLF